MVTVYSEPTPIFKMLPQADCDIKNIAASTATISKYCSAASPLQY